MSEYCCMKCLRKEMHNTMYRYICLMYMPWMTFCINRLYCVFHFKNGANIKSYSVLLPAMLHPDQRYISWSQEPSGLPTLKDKYDQMDINLCKRIVKYLCNYVNSEVSSYSWCRIQCMQNKQTHIQKMHNLKLMHIMYLYRRSVRWITKVVPCLTADNMQMNREHIHL